MIARLLPITTVLATLGLALGYGLNGLGVGTALVSALGLLWLLAQRRGPGWVASAMLCLFVGAATTGLWLGLGAGWMLLGVVGALSAWDLDCFSRRSRDTVRIGEARELERRHLRRLLAIDVLSLLFGTVALGARVRYSFGAALAFGLLAVLCLGQMIGYLRRGSN